MGLTGAKARRWLPVRPGTYGALALGIAHVLLREELHDAAFVRDRTHGFDDWTDGGGRHHAGFRSRVLAEFFPERVAEITGLSSEQIIETARELGIDTPSVVIGGSSVADDGLGTAGQMCVHSLNALLGNFGAVGGVVRAERAPLSTLPEPMIDDVAAAGLGLPTVGRRGPLPASGFSIDAFTQNVLSGEPYPIELLFVLGGNPVFESIRHHDFVEALRRIPVIVSFDSFLNETSEFAEFVLPDPTWLEQWELLTSTPGVGTTHVGVRQPVIEPLFDTRPAAVVVAELAEAVGPTVAAAVAPAEPVESLKARIRGLYEAGQGTLAVEGVRGYWLDYLQTRGWHMGRYDSFQSFWEEMLIHGGWWDPTRPDGKESGFDTSTGRFEFGGRDLAELLADTVGGSPSELTAALKGLGLTEPGPVAWLAGADGTVAEVGRPLHLVVFRSMPLRDGVGANLPLMQELHGLDARRPWRTWAEIHPDLADAYALSDGDWIRLESSVGSLQAQVRIVPTISPECVGVPFGQGHTSYGRYARGVGVNPFSIVRARYDVVSGRPAIQSTKISISRTA
jgi:anaerobic selenocysteine-containing dehydrogenase